MHMYPCTSTCHVSATECHSCLGYGWGWGSCKHWFWCLTALIGGWICFGRCRILDCCTVGRVVDAKKPSIGYSTSCRLVLVLLCPRLVEAFHLMIRCVNVSDVPLYPVCVVVLPFNGMNCQSFDTARAGSAVYRGPHCTVHWHRLCNTLIMSQPVYLRLLHIDMQMHASPGLSCSLGFASPRSVKGNFPFMSYMSSKADQRVSD